MVVSLNGPIMHPMVYDPTSILLFPLKCFTNSSPITAIRTQGEMEEADQNTLRNYFMVFTELISLWIMSAADCA